MSATAAEHWSAGLARWAIPDEILASAEESPWIHPPALFDVPDVIESTPSHECAREALPEGGSVLDVGCGGGVAAFALTPPASYVVGVDHQHEMLVMFARNAAARGVRCDVLEGFWPAVSGQAPVADVVTAHHVAYNVSDIVPFLDALSRHARHRVVLELPDHHPLSNLSGAWRHFWGLERPVDPTPTELLDVLADMDVSAQRVQWRGAMRSEPDLDQAAHFTRIRLCLPASREAEVRRYLEENPGPGYRELSTVWWDVAPGSDLSPS